VRGENAGYYYLYVESRIKQTNGYLKKWKKKNLTNIENKLVATKGIGERIRGLRGTNYSV